MNELLISALLLLPGNLIIAYARTRLLKMRHPLVFIVIYVSVSLFFLVTSVMMEYSVRLVISIVGTVAIDFVMPFVMATGKPVRRILTILASFAVSMIAEVGSEAVWAFMTGTSITDAAAVQQYRTAYYFTLGIDWLQLIMYYLLLYNLINIKGSLGDDKSLRFFLGFPLTQGLLLLMVCYAGWYFGVDVERAAIGGFVTVLFCIAADVILFFVLERYTAKCREEERARALQAQLDWRMSQYEDIAAGIERAAHLRHDLHNQLQLAEELMSRGEHAEAARLLEQMAGALEVVEA